MNSIKVVIPKVMDVVALGPRTVLIEDCPLEWSGKSFKENNIFFVKEVAGSALKIIPKKGVLHRTSTNNKKYGLKAVSANQYIEKGKTFVRSPH